MQRSDPDRYCGEPGSSRLAESFGAEVSIPRADRGRASLFLVVGERESPAGAVRGVGGRVIVQLPDGRKLLALMTFEAQARLQATPGIALVGAVAVDTERFAHFARLVALDRPP